MNCANEKAIRLALGVISGRFKRYDLDMDDFEALGFDPYRVPTDESRIKEKAEEVILKELIR